MKHIKNVLFGLAVLSTMGFGVASAAAQPGEAKTGPICPFVRERIECVECCADGGFNADFVNGYCTCY